MGSVPSVPTRLEFAHARAQWCADAGGIRVLHIKGLAAQQVIPLMDAKVPTDVDVLVEPGLSDDLLSRLHGNAQLSRAEKISHSPRGHAVSVSNHVLGISVDVHRKFPGFRVSDSAVFEELWSSAVPVRFGRFESRTPDRVATALLAIVHAARNRPAGQTTEEAIDRWRTLTESEHREFRRLVRRLEASAAVHSVLGGYPDSNRFEVALYRSYQSGSGAGAKWILAFLSASSSMDRWDVVQRATWSRLIELNGEPRGSAGRSRAGLLRWRRGIESLVRGACELGRLLRMR